MSDDDSKINITDLPVGGVTTRTEAENLPQVTTNDPNDISLNNLANRITNIETRLKNINFVIKNIETVVVQKFEIYEHRMELIENMLSKVDEGVKNVNEKIDWEFLKVVKLICRSSSPDQASSSNPLRERVCTDVIQGISSIDQNLSQDIDLRSRRMSESTICCLDNSPNSGGTEDTLGSSDAFYNINDTKNIAESIIKKYSKTEKSDNISVYTKKYLWRHLPVFDADVSYTPITFLRNFNKLMILLEVSDKEKIFLLQSCVKVVNATWDENLNPEENSFKEFELAFKGYFWNDRIKATVLKDFNLSSINYYTGAMNLIKYVDKWYCRLRELDFYSIDYIVKMLLYKLPEQMRNRLLSYDLTNYQPMREQIIRIAQLEYLNRQSTKF